MAGSRDAAERANGEAVVHGSGCLCRLFVMAALMASVGLAACSTPAPPAGGPPPPPPAQPPPPPPPAPPAPAGARHPQPPPLTRLGPGPLGALFGGPDFP